MSESPEMPGSGDDGRLAVRKTYKLYVGGAFPRSESGRTYEVRSSDGRFLATLAREVIEFGPVNESIHKIDEKIAIADIGPLSAIYERAARALLGA